jgi:hypothetical protein
LNEFSKFGRSFKSETLMDMENPLDEYLGTRSRRFNFAQEIFLSDFFLFGISPLRVDLKNMAGEGLRDLEISEGGVAKLPIKPNVLRVCNSGIALSSNKTCSFGSDVITNCKDSRKVRRDG